MISTLDDFHAYNRAMELGESVWALVVRWSFFEKDTVGKQFVKAVDSIAANLSEGLGRYHYKEKKNFSYYSRGSLFESKTWLSKAMNRQLVTREQFATLNNEMDVIGKMINGYIRSIGDVNEPLEPYGDRHNTTDE
jgi:four helix bundle protein